MSRRIAPLDAGFSESGEGAGHTLRDTEPASAQRRQTWATPAEDARSTFRTMSARGSTISEVESGSGNFSDNTTGNNPIYQSQWDAEFRQHSYSPGPIRTFTTLGALYNLLFGGMGLVESAGDFDHAIQTQAPRMLGGAFSLLFLAVFCVTSLRGFCSRYYDQLCAAWLTSLFVIETVVVARRDSRKFAGSMVNSSAGASKYMYQNISFDRVGWFMRECTDADPERTLLLFWPSFFQPGCRSFLTGGECLFVLCSMLLCPVLLEIKMDGPRACVTTIISGSAYLVICMSLGYLNWSVFWSLILLMTAGVSSVLLCRWRTTQAKQNYAKMVSIRVSARTSRILLHTLIPPGVMKNFSPGNNPVCTAQPISMCIVMFCMFDYKVLTRDDFDWIESLVADLDRAVEQSGMFKYQYVSCGTCHNFIVTCPRGSMEDRPLDARMSGDVDDYNLDMISLGFDLMRVMNNMARKPSFHDTEGKERETPIRSRNSAMKVGLNIGPVAGIVLGTCRRFYCIYGDTVNTAARMCKFSNLGTIRVTQDIGADSRVSTSKYFNSVSQGLVSIKGKGKMEVYDISLNESAAFYGRKSVSRVAVTRTRAARISSELSASGSVEEGSNESRQMVQEEVQLQGDEARLKVEEEAQWQTWLEQRHTLSRFLSSFSNTETEKDYQKSSSLRFIQRKSLTIGILFHLVFTVWQWSVFTFPSQSTDQGPIFHHYGNPELIWRMNLTQALLAGQFFMSVVLSYLAFFFLGNIRLGINTVREFLIRHRLISDPEELKLNDEVSDAMDFRVKPRINVSESKQIIPLCNVLFAMLKILNFTIMFVLGLVWPTGRDQGVNFSLYSMTGYLVSHTIFGVSSVTNIVLVLFSLPATFVATSLSISKSMSTGLNFSEESEKEVMNKQGSLFIDIVLSICGSVCASRFVSSLHRIMWSREQFFSEQLQHMHHHLEDLVPPLYARQLILGCRHIECSPGRVAVLQLDVCNFTVISTSLHPTKLADIVNSLVSDFDKYVVKYKLSKIDTIGDAYIVVAWLLSGDEGDSTLDEERFEIINTHRCRDMLKVADGILSCLEEHREKTGIDLHGRIGVATGDVISGVLGLLQPRFCVFGEGMCRAADLEQSGVKGAVHCSTEFLQFVTGEHSSAMYRNASFNAELRFEYSTVTNSEIGRMRKRSSALVSRMEKQGRLLRQQNMFDAAPAVSIEEIKPIPPVRLSSFSALVSTTIDMNGNFLSCYGHKQYLRRSIDDYGMLVLCGTSSTVLSNSDWSTSVPKSSRDVPATVVQNKSDQVTPDDDTVTHVDQTLQQIMKKAANNVERLGFDVIVPA
jgi:class 3 adenylate cyclase